MILIPATGFEYTYPVFESVCDVVDRTNPCFAQSSGELLAGKYYLLNSSLFASDIGDSNKFVVMRVDHLGNATKKLIGNVGCERFNNFLSYEAGWDSSDAKPLSLESVAMIEVFIANLNRFATEPSLFLTKKGNLKLGWEDSNGMSIEVEFMPASFKYYIESGDEEGTIKLTEVHKLITKIQAIENASTAV